MKHWKIGSIILLLILSVLVWFVSGMFFSDVVKWINYPISIMVFIAGLIYINKHYD